MHFYPHNIPDFNNATRHLTRVERSVYRDAIERYYDTEQPLTGDDFDRLARVLLCFSDEEKDALRSVLDEFFTLENGCYRHERCDTEIAKYRSNTTAKAKAGKASALARKNKSQQVLNGRATDEQLTNNQELITNNQEPIKKNTTGKPMVSLSSWIESTKAKGEKIIPDNDPIFEYASDAGIPDDWLRLVWIEFRTQFVENGKRQKDWRAHFRNFVRKNYYKFWWLDAGQYKLTSIGQQAMNAMNNRDKREDHESV